MIKFTTATELAEAYKAKYNESYNNDPEKSLSAEDVKDVCFSRVPAIAFNRLYGINEKGFVTMVRGFGYATDYTQTTSGSVLVHVDLE